MTSLRSSLLRVALAVGLSFALWAFVSLSQNPEETVTFPEMPLQRTNLGEGLVIVDSNGLPTEALPVVSVTLRTDREQLTTLRPVDISAVIDLTGLGPGEHVVPVNVQSTRGNLSFQPVDGGVVPSAVTVRLEQLSTQEVPVEVEVQGNLPFSFERGEPQVSFGGAPLATVQMSGPQSRIARVSMARATANIEQLRATYLAPLSLEAIDANGQPVEGVSLDPEAVTVEIPINPVVGLKLVPVEPTIVGLPAPGYEVRGVVVEPPLIALAGSSGPLDSVAVLTTAPIDLAGARASLVRTVAINFPEGTSPREGEPDTARVTVQIAPLTMPFQVQLPAPVAVTGAGPGLSVSASPAVVNLSLTGTGAALAGLSQASLRATVDASGLDPGSYVLPVSVDLPEGVSLVGERPTVQVTLRLPVPTITPSVPPDGGGAPATPPPDGDTPTAGPEPATPLPVEPTPGATITPGATATS